MMTPRPHFPSPAWRISMKSSHGFTYLMVLFAIALMGAALAGTGVLWRTEMQREKEVELLFIGDAFRSAISSYYNDKQHPNQYPRSLQDLIEDKSHIQPAHHLRRLYRDPVTDKAKWGLVVRKEGGVVGVYSLSNAQPLKTGNFDPPDSGFAKAKRYKDWVFTYTPSENGSTTPQP